MAQATTAEEKMKRKTPRLAHHSLLRSPSQSWVCLRSMWCWANVVNAAFTALEMISDATRLTRAVFSEGEWIREVKVGGRGPGGVDGAQQLVGTLHMVPSKSWQSRRAFAFECEEVSGALSETQSDGGARPQFPSARPTRFLLLSANSSQPAAAAHATLALQRQAPPQARSESTTVPDHKHSLAMRLRILEVGTINDNPARFIPEWWLVCILTHLNWYPDKAKQHTNP